MIRVEERLRMGSGRWRFRAEDETTGISGYGSTAEAAEAECVAAVRRIRFPRLVREAK